WAAPLELWRMTTASMPNASNGGDRVGQRLALLHAARGHREGQDIRREALGRGLETQTGARRLLEEQRGDHPALERRHLLDGALVDLDEELGRVEHLEYRDVGEFVECQQVASPNGVDHEALRVPIHTPSVVATISSLSDVGRFLPT